MSKKNNESEKTQDNDYSSGKILRSMNTSPHPIAQKIFIENLEINLGDPQLFPNSFQLENETIQLVNSLANYSKNTIFGNFVSGGSEANVLGLWAARNSFRKKTGKKTGQIVLPETAHPSLLKGIDLMGCELVQLQVDTCFKAKYDLLEDLDERNIVAVVGIAGNTIAGVSDPLDQLFKIASEKNLWVHLDAALGGFTYPFIGGEKHLLHGSLEEGKANSMTLDPHKMMSIPIPTGGIVYQSKEMIDEISYPIPYLGKEAISTTISGTRPGAGMKALRAMLTDPNYGWEYYRSVVKRCHEDALWLKTELEKRGMVVPITPETVITVAQLPSGKEETQNLINLLQERGYIVGSSKGWMRIVVMPHVKHEHLESFLNTLEETIT
ncbi:MAG: aminotransferase class V-fold PLP-dependent enzyme [Candidatus Kariarchaeaceae archaeon]